MNKVPNNVKCANLICGKVIKIAGMYSSPKPDTPSENIHRIIDDSSPRYFVIGDVVVSLN